MNIIDDIKKVVGVETDSELAEKLSEISGKKKIDKSRISNWRHKGFFGSTHSLIILLLKTMERPNLFQTNLIYPSCPEKGQLFINNDLMVVCEWTGKKWEVAKNKCIIFGTNKQKTFEKIVVDIKDVKAKCFDIWENVSNYSEYKNGSEEAFYEFSKFLWVKFPNGSEERLSALAHEFNQG